MKECSRFNVEKSISNELENALIHNKHLIKQCLIVQRLSFSYFKVTDNFAIRAIIKQL